MIKAKRIKPKKEYRQTFFGKEYEVIIYPEKGQHRDHLSILAHPEEVNKVRELLKKN